MTILIVGDDSLIDLEIDKILKKEKNYSQIKYDSTIPCDKIIEELNTIDMFYDKKIVIVKDFLNIKEQDSLIDCIEKSKDNNQIEWIKLMNNYRNMTEEIILKELIYD